MSEEDDPTISVREYLELQIKYERELRAEAMRASASEVALAKEAIAYRLEGMNELRQQIAEERGMYVPRAIYDTLDKRMQLQEQFAANIHGRIWMLVALSTVITSAIAIAVNIFLKK